MLRSFSRVGQGSGEYKNIAQPSLFPLFDASYIQVNQSTNTPLSTSATVRPKKTKPHSSKHLPKHHQRARPQFQSIDHGQSPSVLHQRCLPLLPGSLLATSCCLLQDWLRCRLPHQHLAVDSRLASGRRTRLVDNQQARETCCILGQEVRGGKPSGRDSFSRWTAGFDNATRKRSVREEVVDV